MYSAKLRFRTFFFNNCNVIYSVIIRCDFFPLFSMCCRLLLVFVHFPYCHYVAALSVIGPVAVASAHKK